MKIFSLRSKTNLVVWSIIASLLISSGLFYFSTWGQKFSEALRWQNCGNLDFCVINTPKDYGWPFHFNYYSDYFRKFDFSDIRDFVVFPQSLFLNFLFWTLVSMTALSLIRHFTIKKNYPPIH